MFEGAERSENTTHKSSPPGLSLESRRSFLGGLLGLGSFLVGALLSVPLIRFALFPLLRRTTAMAHSQRIKTGSSRYKSHSPPGPLSSSLSAVSEPPTSEDLSFRCAVKGRFTYSTKTSRYQSD
jgi:hypothetical protein